jgi:SAM-dependent methyltransferase
MCNIHTIYRFLQSGFRPKLMREFADLYAINSDTSILDIGGTLFNWGLIPQRPKLTILNITPSSREIPPGIRWVVGDARRIPYPDQSFDIAFSNAVIEHVGCWEDQVQFAKEVQRVGKRYYVKTPNYYFPLEPHLLTPFIHWLPRPIGRKLTWITVRNLIIRDNVRTKAIFDASRLLNPKDMKLLFPDASIRFEKVLGMRKSIIALGC